MRKFLEFFGKIKNFSGKFFLILELGLKSAAGSPIFTTDL